MQITAPDNYARRDEPLFRTGGQSLRIYVLSPANATQASAFDMHLTFYTVPASHLTTYPCFVRSRGLDLTFFRPI